MLNNIYNKIRSLIQDDLIDGYDLFNFVSSKVFTLTYPSIDESTLVVHVNQTQVTNTSASVKYTYSDGKVTFTSSQTLNAGDLIEFNYQGYKNYTDAELRQYTVSAIIRLSVNQYQTFVLRSDDVIYPTPIETDENLIGYIASILLEGNIAQYKTQEIEMIFGADESVEQRIDKLMARWIKCYGVYDYVKLKYAYRPLNDSYDNLH